MNLFKLLKRAGQPARPAPRWRRPVLGLEALEDRLAPASSSWATSAVPSVTTSELQAQLTPSLSNPTAEWLTSVAQVVLTTPLPSSLIDQTANYIQQGLRPESALTRLLATPVARTVMAHGAFSYLFHRPATTVELQPVLAGPHRATDLGGMLFVMAASTRYFRQAGATAAGFRQAISNDLLGGAPLPGSLANTLAHTKSQRERLLKAVFRTSSFKEVWVERLAEMAWKNGHFSNEVLTKAKQVLGSRYGFTAALAHLLATPESRLDIQTRANPRQLNSGDPYRNHFGINRHALVLDSQAVPLDSPWGNAAIFPEVPYASIMAGGAAQPTLQLPQGVVTPADLANGITFQTWFQATGPGALWSAVLSAPGGGTVSSPLVYFNGEGRVVAGLFDPTPLQVVQGQTLFSWTDANGNTQVGADSPLVSQAAVVDNTWHHVAFVVSAQSQALYVDGLLQGVSQPLYRQSDANLTTATNTLTVTLAETPTNGQLLQGSIWQGGNQTYTFQGWLENNQATLALTQTNGSPANSLLNVTYQSGTNSLLFQLNGPVAAGNPVTANVNYLTASSAYSFTPTSSQGLSYSGPTDFTVGGTAIPQPTATPYPEIHYPQGFIGALDETALWTTQLTQPQIQAAATAPISQDNLNTDLAAYFNYDQAPVNQSWSNQAPGQTGIVQGPTQGTLLTTSATTIATDPFTSVARLPGFRNWGLQLMTPLAAPSVTLFANQTINYKVGLAAGDQLGIGLPQLPGGTLTVSIQDDLGQTLTSNLIIAPATTQYLVAPRTGTYQITLTWAPTQSGTPGTVNFEHLPGPLNSLMGLLTSYAQSVSAAQTNTLYAYSDPNLPGINPTLGTGNATGPASYWPLWTDKTYFPSTSAYTPADLNGAYEALVLALVQQNVGVSDFADLSGAATTNPTALQQFLNTAYQTVYGTPPPTPPGGTGNFFPVQPAATAQDAVYEFLSNANLLRQQIYPILTDSGPSANPSSLPQWVQEVINSIALSVAENVATTIAEGQAQQVQNVQITLPTGASAPSVWQIVGDALVWSLGGVLGALGGGTIVGAAVGGAAASVASSFIDQSHTPSTVTLTVPLTPVTNSILTGDTLDDIATQLTSVLTQQWNAVYAALIDPRTAQAVLSNYGLLLAFQKMSSAPLSAPALSPSNFIPEQLERASWQSMVPAAFQWQAVNPTNFPSGDGRSTLWNSTPTQVGKNAFDVAVGDFNNDRKQDLAVTIEGGMAYLLGNGDGTFQNPVTINIGNEPFPLVAADFNQDGFCDVVVGCAESPEVVLYLGSAGGLQFGSTHSLPNSKYPSDLAVADFNDDGFLDLAVANSSSKGPQPLNILLGTGPNGNGFQAATATSFTVPLAYGITTGDFNNDAIIDLAVASGGSNSILTFQGNGQGGFTPLYKSSNFGPGLDIVSADVNQDGYLDLVANFGFGPTGYAVLLNQANGSGTFQTPAVTYTSSAPVSLAVFQGLGDAYPDIVLSADQEMMLLLNQGTAAPGTFFKPIQYSLSVGSSLGAGGIATGDFNGDGKPEIAVVQAEGTKGYVVVMTAPSSGNFATFAPGTGTSANLQNLLPPAQLNTVISQLQQLQSGFRVNMGPYDSTALINPSTSQPPNYMGQVSLPYAPSDAPLNIAAPGYFLALTTGNLTESTSNHSYTQSGSLIAGWQLVDANGNPMAVSTLQALFGAPVVDPAAGPNAFSGVQLAPISATQPMAALNGGWYYATRPAAGSAATWADAFFNWGWGNSNYSPRSLAPANVTSKLQGTSTTFNTIDYSVIYAAPTDGPPEP